MCDTFHLDRSGSNGLIGWTYDSHLHPAEELMCNWGTDRASSKTRCQSCNFVLNDMTHIRNALWILMLGYEKLPALLHLRGPAYITKTNHLPMDISKLSDIF